LYEADGVTTATGFDSLVASLARLEDAVGVLSVYVGVDPRAEASARPPWVVSLDHELAAFRARLRQEGPHERWVAFDRRLRELAPALARVVDATEHGRGRALFAAVGSGEVHSIAVQTVLPTGATLGEVAHVLPLLAADEGAPMGIVLVGRDIVRALEARLGAIVELASFDVEPSVANGPERKGPAASNPLRAQHVVSQRERYERHVEAGHRGLLEKAAEAVSGLAVERGWELAVVAGDPRGGGPLLEELRRHGIESELVDRDLAELRPAQALDKLAPILASFRRRRDLGLVQRARDAALSGGRGALGLADTLTALAEGGVDHLLLDGSRDIVGAVGPEGELLPAGIVPPGVTGSELRSEPLLADRAALRALESGARVTVVDGEAALSLADADGIAALLRW
jgi:Bacterial archaeo-eukaryotic release factor family 10